MRIVPAFSIILVLSSFASVYGQTQQIATIDSSYPVTIPAGSALTISTVSLGVSYPVGLAPGSYVSGTQLNTDFQGFLGAYPSPADPPEAILSTILQSILNKYPQMTGGSLTGEINGSQTIGGITIPIPGAGGTVIVLIGNYGGTGSFPLVRHPAKTKPASVR